MFSIEFYWLFLFCCLIFLFAKFNREFLVYILFLFYNILFITIIKFNYIDLDIQTILQTLSDVIIFGVCICFIKEAKEILKFFSFWILFFITDFQIVFIGYPTIQELLFQIDNYNLDYLCLFIITLILKQREYSTKRKL